MTNILEQISRINGIINGYVWGVPMLCLIIGTGVFYIFRNKAFQFTHVKDIYESTIKGIFSKKENKKKYTRNGKKRNTNFDKTQVLSQFQALSTALASTIGTGNIAGVSTAIVVGGPGSIFWMWICALVGMGTHFAEIVLGLYYRKYDKDNGYSGGPMYYLENGIGKEMKLPALGKTLAILFACFTFLASYGIGNMTQVNSISEAVSSNFGVPSLVIGIVLATLVALIIFGGVQRIGMVAEKIVPFMAVFYLFVGTVIVLMNIKNVPLAFISIFTSAFSVEAIAGGVLGYIIKRAITYGFKRGAFSNEAGLGSSVIAHSASSENEPVRQALWGIFEVFFDTIVVCTFTSLILLTTSINAPAYDSPSVDYDINEKYVCIDDSYKNVDGEIPLVDNRINCMPFKLDSANNAKLFDSKPNDGKEYLIIKIYGKDYFVEKFDMNDINDNSFFFGNVLKIKANPLHYNDGSIIIDKSTSPEVDSIHVENLSGVSLVTHAVSKRLSHWAGKLLAIAITLFAFTTVLGWSYYGTKTIEYLFGKIGTYVYKFFFVIFIVIGCTMNLNLAWDIADTLNGLMAIPNLIGVVLLSGTVVKVVKNYYDRKAGKKVKPMTSFYNK